jgi:hypothetical protein
MKILSKQKQTSLMKLLIKKQTLILCHHHQQMHTQQPIIINLRLKETRKLKMNQFHKVITNNNLK